MKVDIKIPIYERDGKETQGDQEGLFVRSHWNRNGAGGLVVLCIGENEITVSSDALVAAVERCVGLP